MFCTHCGVEVSRAQNFCGHCGTAVDGASDAAPGPSHELEDWRETSDLRVVLHHPEVRGLVEAAAGVNGGQLTAEEFLASVKPLLSAAGLGAVPFTAILDAAPRMYARWGLKTGKAREAHLPFPVGRTMAGALCSLASRGQAVIDGTATGSGSSVTARLPSSVLTHRGEVSIVFEGHAAGTQLHAQITIPGQAFDWGRCARVLDDLVADIPRFVSLQP